MYTTRSFMDIIETFRTHRPDFNFTTDIIVGFPGETEEDFEKSIHIAREARFSHIHTFRYSRRKGTRAERMDEQLEEKTKAERSELIRQVSEENRLRYMESMLGKEQRVLIEKADPKGVVQGYGEHYLPVHFPASDGSRNTFRKVVLQRVEQSASPFIWAVD
jgi:threonylcarbamoyladenosine tRNA methylthiotransferase MtaB